MDGPFYMAQVRCLDFMCLPASRASFVDFCLPSNVEENWRLIAQIVSSLWSHLSLNFWTSYSCFLSWNDFLRKQISVYRLTDGHNTVQSTRGRLHGLSLKLYPNNMKCMLNKSFSSRPKYIIQGKERFFWQGARNLAGEVGCHPCATYPT